jgi:serine protease Do
MNADLAAALGIPSNRGTFIQSVQPGEPAEAAGLRSGDVVLAVDGQEVTREQNLSYLVANVAPGRRINLEVLRDGRRMTIPVTVKRRPSEEELRAQAFDPEAEDPMQPQTPQGEGVIENSLGIQVIPLTPQIAGQVGVPSTTRGVVIAVVDPSSDAATKQLARGTVVIGANGRDVTSPADLEAAIRAARSEGRTAILLRVMARGAPQPVSIPIRLR